MKKYFVFAFVALTIHAFAQDIPINSGIWYPTTVPLENINFSIYSDEMSSTDLPSNPCLQNFSNHQDFVQQALILENDSIYSWIWDTINSGWKIDRKELNIYYDASNNWISGLIQKWDGSAWVNNLQYNSIYDTYNNLINDISQKWNGTAWVNYQQYHFTYDVYNNRTGRLFQYWDGSAWVNSRRHIYTFDAGNFKTLEFVQTWNVSAWQNDYQRIFAYDASGNMINQLSQYWFNGEWNNGNNLIITYNTNNYEISDLVQVWDHGSWKNSGQGFITYDANNNMTSRLNQKLIGSIWVDDYQRTYTYDANNFRTSYTYKDWNDACTKLIRGDSSTYYFHTVMTGINDLNKLEESISAYPNPGNGKFTVKSNSQISGIEIYNLSGCRIYSDFKFSQQTVKDINLSDYPKGIYFIKFLSGTKSYNSKIVLQ